MSPINTQSLNIENPLFVGLSGLMNQYPLPVDEDTGELGMANALIWIEDRMMIQGEWEFLGFDPAISYPQSHLDTLARLLKQMVESPSFRASGTISPEYVRSWQELQGKVLIEQMSRSIEPIAGDVLLNVSATRTRIGDLMEKPGLSSMAKAGISAGSFGIMGLFQYRFLESFFQAIAQHDISQWKTGAMVQLVQNHSAMLGTGIGWSVLSACAFAYLVKEWFETHLSDKLHGTKQTKKKWLCALGCATLLGIEMTGSFSRITIGTDLKEQVVDMKKGVKRATEGDKTVFVQLDTKAWDIADTYESEWKALFDAESQRWWIGPYAAAKQAAYVPMSQIDWSKVDRVPGLRQKVERLYAGLESHRNKMKTIQESNWLDGSSGQKETTWPRVIGIAWYQVDKVAKWLNTLSTEAVDELLESHNLVDPALWDIVMDLVFDAGKKLHPQDVNALRAVLDRQIDKSGKNVDALTDELARTIDTLDAFMREITDAADATYKTKTAYSPKPKPERIDTSALKNALNSTKVPVSVLDPLGVWGKFIELSANGTIPLGYSLALLLRVLLVEWVLLAIGSARVRKTTRALSTPGARFEDLARETDGQYLKIVALVERLTGGESWKMLNGRALSREEIHTLISSALASARWQSALGNQMSVVDMKWKDITSKSQRIKDLLGAAFFWQYSAPEIRRLRALDKSLTFWSQDIKWVDEPPKINSTWLQWLRGMVSRTPRLSDRPTQDLSGNSVPTWELPPISVKDGKHAIQGHVQQILGTPQVLKTLSDATAKRQLWEDISSKRRQYESARMSLSTFLEENNHLLATVSEIRSNRSNPLHDQVKVLDETGDVFWYYGAEVWAIDQRMTGLMKWQDEKSFYLQRDTFLRRVGDTFKSRLALLRDSGLLDRWEKSEIVRLLGLQNHELLVEENYTFFSDILTRYSAQRYISERVLQKWWEKTPEFNYQVFNDWLNDIDNKVKEWRDLIARRKKIQGFLSVNPENVTELQVMELRNATAQIKSFLETKNK